MVKICKICLEEKNETEFYTFLHKDNGKTYFNSYCKRCDYERKNRQKENERLRKYKYADRKTSYNKRDKNRVANLSDVYMKQLICSKTSLHRGDVPVDLIKDQRELTKITRRIKQIKEALNEQI